MTCKWIYIDSRFRKREMNWIKHIDKGTIPISLFGRRVGNGIKIIFKGYSNFFFKSNGIKWLSDILHN